MKAALVTGILSFAVFLHACQEANSQSPDPRQIKTNALVTPRSLATEKTQAAKRISSPPATYKICPPESTATITPLKVYIVSSKQGSTRADQKPKFAVSGERILLNAVLKAREGGRTVFFTSVKQLRIGRRLVPRQLIKKWNKSCQPNITWFKVEANQSSFVCDSKKARCGSSRRPIPYVETEFAAGWQTLADVHPTTFPDQFKEIETG